MMRSHAEWMNLRVNSIAVESPDVRSFELCSPDGADLPPFAAGAHIDVQLESGLVRQYSLCNDPTETRRYRIGVLRETRGRGGSAAMHRLEPGAHLQARAPRNAFPLAPQARRSLLFAGGIGITPMLAMAHALHSRNAEFELHYCTRSIERTPFLGALKTSGFGANVILHLDGGDARQRLDASGVLGRPEAGKHAYLCGPPGFIAHVRSCAVAKRWDARQIHSESFSPSEAPISGSAFQVDLRRRGKRVAVEPGQSIVQALAGAGIVVPVSCEQGICGTCLTSVLEGIPEHRDMYLTPQEQAANDRILLCCSRSRSPVLALDL